MPCFGLGGPRLEEECRDHVRKGGEIHPGAVFVSSAGGSLPHKSVIHTVGPVWKDGKSGEDRDLQQATLAALREAENRYYQSVSLPFLSCGIFSFPKKRAATIIVRTIKEFLSHSKYVYEVHIVNGIQDCLNTLQSAFTEFSSDFELTPSVFSGPSSGNCSSHFKLTFFSLVLYYQMTLHFQSKGHTFLGPIGLTYVVPFPLRNKFTDNVSNFLTSVHFSQQRSHIVP